MSTGELSDRLDEAIHAFGETIRGEYSETGNRVVHESDIHEVARQAFYAMSAMKDAIVEYLEGI